MVMAACTQPTLQEEKVCRFCSSELQDWRQAVQETLPAASLGPQVSAGDQVVGQALLN
jgi:hypothetical protein